MRDIQSLLLIAGSFLTACSDSNDDPVEPQPGQETITGDDASDKAQYKVTQTAVNNNGKSTQTVALRYYDDMPHVAYISVSDFQTMLMPTKFRGDICGIVEALDEAAADPEVKNFVLDLTCNGGGESTVLGAITNLLAGKSSMTYENVLTKQRVVDDMVVDGNFDRVFDDKDKAPRHPQLNIAIMTSNYAFSCGNLLPSLMKDYGYLIIGEKSGGGSFLLPIQGFVGERSVIEREQKPLLLVAVARPPSFRPLHITSGVALLNDKYQRQLMIFISPDKNA